MSVSGLGECDLESRTNTCWPGGRRPTDRPPRARAATVLGVFDASIYTGAESRLVLAADLRVLPQVRGTRESAGHLAALAADAAFAELSGKYFDGLKPIASSSDSYDRDKALDL